MLKILFMPQSFLLCDVWGLCSLCSGSMLCPDVWNSAIIFLLTALQVGEEILRRPMET